jgi:nucleoside phosphorylase
MFKILILATLPQEYAPLKKLVPSRFRRICRKPFKKFAFSLPGKEITLVETGMGEEHIEKALGWAVGQSKPDLLLFGGFCGGLHTGLRIGDVCIVERAVAYRASAKESKKMVTFRFPDELRAFLADQNIRSMTAFTIAAPEDKLTLTGCVKPFSALCEGDGEACLPGVDMETHALAGIACRLKLPLLCFRSVSDEVSQELGFDLDDITGPGGKVKVGKVLSTILIHPGTLQAFFLAWRRSVKAAGNLCAVLTALLTAPGDSLNRIARGIRID